MQRAYRHDLRCPYCGSNWLPKYGRSKGRQSYRCGDFLYKFAPGGNRSYFSEAVKSQAVEMYCEGSAIAAISRVLGVKAGTVWVRGSKKPGSRCPTVVGCGEHGAQTAC